MHEAREDVNPHRASHQTNWRFALATKKNTSDSRNRVCERCGGLFDARPWNTGRYCTRKCMIQTPAQRFWAKVEKGDSCWMWRGNTHPVNGYGSYGVDGTRTALAHRYSYELAHGPIPKGLHVCHHCDVRDCVNPAHLFLGTAADNQADKVAKGRQLKGSDAGMAVLTDADVLAIRASSDIQRVIAARYGISRPNVSLIRSRKTWSHL